MRNISPNGGLLNNTMVKVIEITRRLIKVLILANNQVHYIPRINFTISLPRKNFSITRIQFPLRSGYSRTVNRSQGTTLDKLGLDMREEPFSHGQLFVALSRVRSSEDIIILTSNPTEGLITRNVVYPELLK